MLLFCFSRICLLTMIINQIHGYLLLAANLDDFRSIAKKFIPEKLADQLAEMASKSSVKYHKKAEETDIEYESNQSEKDGVGQPDTAEMPKAVAKKRYVIKNPIPEVNLDELVEKVRERLLKGKNKPNQKTPMNAQKAKYPNKNVENTMKSPNKEGAGYIEYNQNSSDEKAENREPIEKQYEEVTTKRQKPQIKTQIVVSGDKITEEEVKDYQESVKSVTEPNQYADDDKIFHEFDLQNSNDSYEDYVLPDKEKMFQSDETRTTKRRPIRAKIMKRPASKSMSAKEYDDLKARTESLLYDEKEVRVNRIKDGAIRNSKNVKKGKGTMIPTREYYKMSSPDYYKKLHVIAEKYNFDEPLPDKDREPENLKPIGHPPARINKKVIL